MSDTKSNVVNITEAGIQPGGDIEFRRSRIATDKAAAEVFMNTYGAYVKHNPAWGWLVNDNRRWKRDEEGAVTQMAMEVGEHFRNLAMQCHAAKDPPQLVKYILAHARHCEKANGIAAFLKLAEPAAYTPVEAFDAHPFKLNFQNCTLDFDHIDGDVPRHYGHRSPDNITKVVPVDWHMGAPCPRWESFLEEIFPAAGVRVFVQRAVGYSLLGSTREQVFFIAYGSGANGKSTFLNVLLRIIGGDYAAQCDPASFMAQRGDRIRSDLARLCGVRFVSCIETGENKRLDEAMVKAATGGDPIVCEHKYQAPFQFRPEWKLWLATNHRPRIVGTDYAMWRRVRLIPFAVTIPEDKRDNDLEVKLLREAEGILDWAVTGAVEYMKDGLQAPDEVVQATAEYQKNEDTIGRFLEDCTVREPAASVAKGDLHRAFKEWCEREGEYAVSAKKFGMYLSEHGFDEYRRMSKRFWMGIGLHAEN